MSQDKEVLQAIERYLLKPRGLLKVTVEKAEGIKAMDADGKSDPQVCTAAASPAAPQAAEAVAAATALLPPTCCRGPAPLAQLHRVA
jgi:hypothetical protein